MVNLKLLKDDNTDRSLMWEYDEKGYGKDGAGWVDDRSYRRSI
ncbi:MAG: hypothetical protein CM15mV13_2250 [uncultured marine virus]|nr:MAG: hypothetical protein CM15mV13_2250 [uncultured marine virus]